MPPPHMRYDTQRFGSTVQPFLLKFVTGKDVMMMDESTIRILMSSDFMSSDSERGSTGGTYTTYLYTASLSLYLCNIA